MTFSLSIRLLLDLCIYKFPRRSMLVNKSSLLIIVCSGRTYRPYNQCDLALFPIHFWCTFGCSCGADRVFGDSSYCKVMQCETSCHRSIVQCEHSSDLMLPQIVVQCENSSDPMTLKIVQCELCIIVFLNCKSLWIKAPAKWMNVSTVMHY